MQLHFHCPSCVRDFSLSGDPVTEDFLDGMTEPSVWCALGDGETIEDNLSTALATQDACCCPTCGQPAHISQETLGRFARALLVQW